jgi:NAD(P)-dependent dehydrogenase (short-subunit alcohol dehydrogenase family)
VSSQEFAGRVAVITGAGRGFGKAFSVALAERGARVVIVDIDEAAGEEAAAEIRAAGHDARAVAGNVADNETVIALIDRVVADYGGIDILINNAGLHSAAYNKPMYELGYDKLRALFDVNVMAIISFVLAARPAMIGRPGACIVNLSSSAAYQNRTAYGASKLAVRGLTMTAAHELGPDGIRVNAIAPGLHLTDTIRAELSEDVLLQVKAQQILPMDGAESDIVDAMLFLCSDQARFITGETLRVSAGLALSV